MPAADVTVGAEFELLSSGVYITIEGPRDEAVAIIVRHSAGHTPPTTISRSAGESVTFTLDSPDYSQEALDLLWFVEGELKTGTGNSLTINAVDYVERIYSLVVMIKVDAQWYSAETFFTVVGSDFPTVN
jgi:hypothetical protein